MEKSVTINEITVISNGSTESLRCSMSDGSTWYCNKDGTNWKMDIPPTDKLNELFNKHETR